MLLGYVGLIFLLSSRSHTDPFEPFPHWDKLVHGVEYGILGFLGQRALRLSWPPRTPRQSLARIGLVLACGLCIAAGDETYQGVVPGRISSSGDLLADMVGMGGGLMLGLVGHAKFRRPASGRMS